MTRDKCGCCINGVPQPGPRRLGGVTVPVEVPTVRNNQAACADRLDLVDAAYERPGSHQAETLKRKYCPHCPIAKTCLTNAMTGTYDWGIWGATTPYVRTQHGGPRKAA